MDEQEQGGRVSLGVAAAVGGILVLGYVLFEVITAPEPTPEPAPWEAPPATTSPLAAVEQPTSEGFDLLTHSASDPAAVARAGELFAEARRRDAEDAAAWFGLGWAAQLGGDPARAEAMYRLAIGLSRRQPVATDIEYYSHFNLAWLYRERGAAAAAEIEQTWAEILTADPAAAGHSAESVAAHRAVYDLARALAAAFDVDSTEPALRAALDAWRSGDLAQTRALMGGWLEEAASAPPAAP